MGPKSHDKCLSKIRKKRKHRQGGEGHVKKGTEIRVTQPLAKERQGQGTGRWSPRAARGNMALPQLDCRFLDSTTLRK